MKKKYIIIMLMLFYSNIFSQECKNYAQHKQKIEAEKVAYITEKLNFSVEEAQKFWPVYNQLEDKKEQFHKQKRALQLQYSQKSKELSDTEIEKIIDNLMQINLKIEELKIEYHNQFKKIIGVKKAAQLYNFEIEFRKTLLRNLNHKTK